MGNELFRSLYCIIPGSGVPVAIKIIQLVGVLWESKLYYNPCYNVIGWMTSVKVLLARRICLKRNSKTKTQFAKNKTRDREVHKKALAWSVE